MMGKGDRPARRARFLGRWAFRKHSALATQYDRISPLGGLIDERRRDDDHRAETLQSHSINPVHSLRRRFRRSIDRQLAALQRKDLYTARHSRQVEALAYQIGRRLGLSPEALETITVAAVLHDMGKIGIPDCILKKPGRLTQAEFYVMKQHPAIGAAILEPRELRDSLHPLVLYHHEWYDGSGYPDGLRGDNIPLGAAVIQAADCMDAMLSPRSYKRGFETVKVISEFQKGSGVQFNPAVAAEAIKWLENPTTRTYSPVPILQSVPASASLG